MAQPVYKFWTAKFKDAWYKLSADERKAIWDKNEESLKKAGVESMVACASLDEEWDGWGVEKYPSLEALQQHASDLMAMNWYLYFEATSKLGVDMPPM